jgi:Uma2 family endonuclease
MAETPRHRDNLAWLVDVLRAWFQNDKMVYVSGNMMMYYIPGNPRRHLSPDVFVTRGIPKVRVPERGCYLVWEEGKGPDVVIELTSKSTRKEDVEKKFHLYQDVLKVQEYFLFDPLEEYLNPTMQGFRLNRGKYSPIRAVQGRLPSKVLGLHLERDGWLLRLRDPAAGKWFLTPPEERAARAQAEAEREQEKHARQDAEEEREREKNARQDAEVEREREKNARQDAEAEIARLREQLEAFRGGAPEKPRNGR